MSGQSALFTTDDHDAGVLRRIRVPADVQVTAEINGPYRPKLKHVWNQDVAIPRMVLWLMTNPSDARLEFTDSTIAKCGRLSRRWGYDGLMVGNACDHRHKNPKELLRVEKPRSDRNIPAIIEMASEARLIVLGYGRMPGHLSLFAEAMVAEIDEAGYSYKLHTVKLLEGRCPGHPLYVPEDSKPVPYTMDAYTAERSGV